MANNEPISPQIRRFILTSVDSIPHLEAMLLLRANENRDWDVKTIAQGLFIGEKRTAEILDDLVRSGFVSLKENALYSYDPKSDKLREMVANLSRAYSSNLIEVTNIVHSKINKQAQKFGDAFFWREG